MGLDAHANNLDAKAKGERDMLHKVLLGDMPLDYFTKDGMTAMHVACRRGGGTAAVQFLCDRALLGKNLDPFILNSDGMSPLHCCAAAEVDTPACMSVLLECLQQHFPTESPRSMAATLFRIKNHSLGHNCAMLAAAYGNWKILQYILGYADAHPDLQLAEKFLPYWSASLLGEPDRKGRTIVHLAAHSSCPQMLRCLAHEHGLALTAVCGLKGRACTISRYLHPRKRTGWQRKYFFQKWILR